MGVRTDDRATETIIFDLGVRQYIKVTAIMIFDQVYVTDYYCNWPIFRVGLMHVTIRASDNKTNFQVILPTYDGDIPLLLT